MFRVDFSYNGSDWQSESFDTFEEAEIFYDKIESKCPYCNLVAQEHNDLSNDSVDESVIQSKLGKLGRALGAGLIGLSGLGTATPAMAEGNTKVEVASTQDGSLFSQFKNPGEYNNFKMTIFDEFVDMGYSGDYNKFSRLFDQKARLVKTSAELIEMLCKSLGVHLGQSVKLALATVVQSRLALLSGTQRQGKGWTNRGKEGSHGHFSSKKKADDQRKAMFANGFKG